MLTNLIKLLLLGFLGVFLVPAFAGLEVKIDVASHATGKSSANKIPADERGEWQVLLDDSFIVIRSPQNITVLDFKGRRRFVLDPASKTYVANSLFDTIAFRVLELQNRETLSAVLASAKIDASFQQTVDNEHNLSLLSRTPANVIAAVEGESVMFSSGDRKLAQWTNAGFEVSPEDARRFSQFVRYAFGGHPQVLQRLSSGHQIPNQISLVFAEAWGSRNQVITVKSVDRIEGKQDFLKGYVIEKTAPDAIDALLDRAATSSPDAPAEAVELNQKETDRAFQESRTFEAFLGWMEGNLMTGKPPPISPERIELFKADPSVLKFSGAVSAKTKEAMGPAIQTFIELRPEAGKKAYILGIFEANDRLKTGDGTNAKKQFEEALDKNIFLAGVYKDLGDLLLSQFDTPHAWRCWDQGRKFGPSFPNFASVNQFEQRVLAQHPEYFE